MSLAKFSVENRVVVNLFMIIIFILGFYSMYVIPKEATPEIDFGSASIRVSYPGVSPAEIEYQIVKKIEEQIQNLEDIDYYTSTAQEGAANVRIVFDAKVDSDKAFDKLVNEVAKITDLPSDAGDPVLMQMKMREMNEMADIALTGDFSPNSMREIAEALQELLLNVEYMSKVEIHGVQEQQVHIDVDMDVMNQLGITFSDLTSLIQARNMNVPGGTVNFGLAEFIVRTMGEFTTVHELGSLIVKSDEQGRAVFLNDIADIEDGLEDRTIISKLDGKDSVTLQVYKKAEGNIIDVMQNVHRVVEEYAATVPGLNAVIRNDDAVDVKKSVSNLGESAVQGILLVFILLWIFLGWKNSILVSIGIPFSFTMTIWLMNYVDITINNMSIFGLIIVLGMIVDNSIVIIENVWRHIEKGLSVKEAAVIGANEVSWPVVAAVSTVIISFMPILHTSGQIGRFIGAFPIIISLSLGASFIQSLVILPAHITQFVKPKAKDMKKAESHFYRKMQKGYQRILFNILKHRGKAVGAIVLSFVICIVVLLSGPVRFDFFPRRPAPSMTLRVKTPVGTNIEITNAMVSQIEEFLLDIPESVDIEAIITTVGQMRENRQWKRESSNAEIKIDLLETEFRKFSNQDIRQKVRDYLNQLPGVYTYSFDETRGGPPVGLDMDIRVRGDDLNRLEYIANYIKEEVSKFPGVNDIENSFSPGKEELKLVPIHEKLAMYGISVSQISSVVRTAAYGSTVTQFRGTGIDEYDVILRAKDHQIDSFEDLKHLQIRNQRGQLIQLDEIVTFEATRGYAAIQHYDGKRSITITANAGTYIDAKGKSRQRTSNEIQEYLFGNAIRRTTGVLSNFNQRFPGYHITSGGMAETQRNSYNSLFRALFLALAGVYIILATQFKSYVKPLIIMLTIPFAFIGVTLGLLGLNLPFSLNTFIAVVALCGIVVGNSIVLLDFIERQRENGLHRWESIISSGAMRLRPIILTSVTSIGGFLPMILSTAESTRDWKPMAVAMSFGLGFSTILTLFVIPCVFSFLDSINIKFGSREFDGHKDLRDIDVEEI